MNYLKKSRIEEVLIAILGKGAVTSRLISRIEKILDAIRTDGSYDGPVMSEVEEILVCILNGESFEKPTHSRIAAMLKVKANGGEYTELRKSRVEELIFEWINAVESATYTGTLPATLKTVEGYLESYKIYGNTEQNGTPAPETPIYPTANGVKQADGTYSIPYGYKLPLTVNGVEYPIYIGDTTLAKDEYVDSATGKIYRRTENLSPPEEEWTDEWIWGDGTVHPSTEIKTSPFIDVSTCETCIMEVFSTETEWAAAGYRAMAFYDENKQYLGWIGGGGGQTLTPNSTERWSEFPAGTVYVRIGCSHGDQPFYPQLVSGYTPTHQFYPYLVPTDPPAPFPQIPTVAGTTVIDYNGEPKPDKVELTYSKPK